jgi:hypothetical protein
MRTLNNWLLVILAVLLFKIVFWIQQSDPLLGYTLGVALIGICFFTGVERLNPRK